MRWVGRPLFVALFALLAACAGERPREPGWSERRPPPNVTEAEAEIADILARSRAARAEFVYPTCAAYFDAIDACVARLADDDREALDEELYDHRYAWKELIAGPEKMRSLIPTSCGLALHVFPKRYACP